MHESLILNDEVEPVLEDGVYNYHGKTYFPMKSLDLSILAVYEILLDPKSFYRKSIETRLLNPEFLYVPGATSYKHGSWYVSGTNKKVDPKEAGFLGYRQPD